MKLAVLCHPSAGGSGVVATELALALVGLGHEVHVVATQLPFRLTTARFPRASPDPSGIEAGAGALYYHQVDTASYPLFDHPLTTLSAGNTLADVIEEHGVEIVHAHYAIPHATSALLARDMTSRGTKVVTTLHGTDVTLVGLEPAFSRSTRHAIERSDGVTAVSRYLAQHTRDTMGARAPIEVVHNWVDPDRFRPDRDPASRARFARPDETLVVHVSNFRPVKRPQDVIRVFARIARERPARLIAVGDGPERSRAHELARRLGVHDRVHFLGSFPSVETVLGVADLFLLPSEQESFGLVALEAMACGVPVVSSDAGGLPEVVLEGETGYLRPPGDADAMAEASLGLLADEDRRRAFGDRARDRAVREFRPGVILPRYIEVYRKVLDGRPVA